MSECYRMNTLRFAGETCEPASTVVDAAYGSCRREEMAYVRAYAVEMRKFGLTSHSGDAEDIITKAKSEKRQTFLAMVLDGRIKIGLCGRISN